MSLPSRKTIEEEVDKVAKAVVALQKKIHAKHDDRTAVDRMRDGMNGHPRAAASDHAGGRSGVLWCWAHGRELRACHLDNEPCKGESLVGPSDPTGTAAMEDDRAAQDLKELGQNLRTLLNVTDLATVKVDRYPARPPSDLERAKTTNANLPHCESCARIEQAKGVPFFSEPHANGSGEPYKTTVKDKLPRPMWLCLRCEVHVRERGCLPNAKELEARRDGRRLVCPHPLLKEQEMSA